LPEIALLLLHQAYRHVAEALTDLENHRTQEGLLRDPLRSCEILRDPARSCEILRDSPISEILRDPARFTEILRDPPRSCEIH